MNNTHDLLAGVKGILVKDFTPKYSMIELIESKDTYPFAKSVGLLPFKPIGLLPFKKVKKDYGNRKIIYVMDFNDTHTTSIAIEMRKDKEGEQEEN